LQADFDAYCSKTTGHYFNYFLKESIEFDRPLNQTTAENWLVQKFSFFIEDGQLLSANPSSFLI